MKTTARVATAVLVAALIPITGLAEEEANWSDRLKFKGDLRLRYEGIDEEGEEERQRGRYRARLAVSAAVNDNVKVVMQIASGADDPVSRNVTFDGGFNVDDIGFDLVYAEWTATDALSVFGGKMKNPLFLAGNAPLIWDSDLNPEGLALLYSKPGFFANLASFSVEERSSSGDSLLTALQVGGKFNLADDLKLTAGVGYFGYSNTVGNEPFWDGAPRGNSVDAFGDYLYDYKDTEVFAQLDTKLADLPMSFYAQWIQNNEVDVEDTGYAIGVKLGSAKSTGEWEASWTFMDVEADALISTFNDSDFGGGQTDASGHVLKAKYVLASSISLGGTFFINEIDEFAGNEHDYNRFQIDVVFKFE